MSRTILITGGAGYIGSHTALGLLERGDEVVLLDDLSRGSRDAVARVADLAGRAPALVVGDVGDPDVVGGVLREVAPDAVVHCAAYKSVDESVREPARYEAANVEATRVLARAMAAAECRQVVFASTAAVYGDADVPEAVAESAPLRPLSPYASTKVRGEALLDGLVDEVGAAVCHLRFFNVCGAHPSGTLGERTDHPENLLPILLLAVRRGEPVARIFGGDWPTRDGTPVRDYVHVLDVASGIVAALDGARATGTHVFNLGTGRGTTVLEMVDAVEQATGVTLERHMVARRPGDPAVSVAAVDRIREVLGWAARHDVAAMARDAWRWLETAPDGRWEELER